jgi:AraC family transcriptional regulator of adaptative response / DNA-3-methyladenine glycosylase II
MELDFDTRYRAIQSRDARFDGQFFTAVTSTGIYCRPICPAQTPLPQNTQFYPSASAAEAAGFRACRRCRPDAAPHSPDWNVRADLVGRALRLIAEGAVDSDRVSGLAERLAVSPRHLHRELVAEVGAGPLVLARTRRTKTARLLIDQTSISLSEIAFVAGFGSIRQFNDSMRAAFGCNPSHLRRREQPELAGSGGITLRLAHRLPFDGASLLEYLGRRAVPGIETVSDGRYRRTVVLGRSAGTIEIEPLAGTRLDSASRRDIRLRLQFDDLSDLTLVVQRCRQLFDLDADPAPITGVLAADPVLAPIVAANPGLRVPGTVDGWEVAVRAVLGQQVSVMAARTLAGRLTQSLGTALDERSGPGEPAETDLTHCFPRPEAVAEADLDNLGITRARAGTLRALAGAVANGEIALDRGADREETTERLLSLPGVGPWTASYIAMRALGDPDAFLPGDLGVRRAAEALGLDATPRRLLAYAERWRPWRAYAVLYLWQSLTAQTTLRHFPSEQAGTSRHRSILDTQGDTDD